MIHRCLEKIKSQLYYLTSIGNDEGEIQFNDLYLSLRKDLVFRKCFPHRSALNTFLLNSHKRGELKKVWPHYRLEKAGANHYNWYFFSEEAFNEIDSPILYSRFTFSSDEHLILASNGEVMRSKKECRIYESLLKLKNYHVWYDYPLSQDGSIEVANFYIKNEQTGDFYLWEHFHSEVEPSRAEEKLRWYKEQGFDPIEEKGQMIFTFEKDNPLFSFQIEEYLNLIS